MEQFIHPDLSVGEVIVRKNIREEIRQKNFPYPVDVFSLLPGAKIWDAAVIESAEELTLELIKLLNTELETRIEVRAAGNLLFKI